jgi:hypothetical protein
MTMHKAFLAGYNVFLEDEVTHRPTDLTPLGLYQRSCLCLSLTNEHDEVKNQIYEVIASAEL